MKKKQEKLDIIPLFAICESIHGNWHYHLFNKKTGKDSKALCGAQTMLSGSPLETWGFKPDHMPSSYCLKCEKLSQLNPAEPPQDQTPQPNKVWNMKNFLSRIRLICHKTRLPTK